MNINEYLKKIEKTKIELARDLNLSRPTLNQYIELYESGHKIENDRYDIIFNSLFSNENLSRTQFDAKVDSVKLLLERDKKYEIGNLSSNAADWVARIHNSIVQDMSKELWNNKVYDTIIKFIYSYRTNVIIRELAEYFSDLNSDSDLSDLTVESKAYYAYFYKCFHEIIDKTPDFDEKEYELFLKRREENINDRKRLSDSITKNIQARMQKILEEVELEFKQKGVDASEEEIMSEVVRLMKR